MEPSKVEVAPVAASPAPPAPKVPISRRLLAKAVLSNWAFLFVNVLVAFWMTPFVVRHLGNSTYGIWALVLQLTGYMGVVDVGLRSALVRFVAKFQAQGDDRELNDLLNCTLALYASIVPLCFCVAAFVAFVAVPRMQLPAGSLGIAQVTVFIAAACMALDFLFATSHACLAGFSRWDVINGIWISVLLGRTALTVSALLAGYGLIALALIQLCMSSAGYLAEVIYLRRLLPYFRLRPRLLSMERIRPILSHGWYSLLLSVANRINYQVDSIVIAMFLPVGEVTFYIIGMRLIEYLRDLLNSTTLILAPIVSSMEAVGESHTVVGTILRSTRYSLIVGFLGSAGLIVLGPSFIKVWMGPSFTKPSGTVVVILTIGLVASCTQFAAGHVLFGLSKHQLNVTWTFIESIVNLSFSLLLVRRYGIFGVAAGTALGNVVIRGWLFPRAFLRMFEIKWTDYLAHAVLPAAVPAVLFAAGTVVCRYFIPVDSYQGLLLVAILSLLPSAIGLWLIGLETGERQLLHRKARELAVVVSG